MVLAVLIAIGLLASVAAAVLVTGRRLPVEHQASRWKTGCPAPPARTC
jgi:hypothetical protein